MSTRLLKSALVVCACAGLLMLSACENVPKQSEGHLATPPVAPVKPVVTPDFLATPRAGQQDAGDQTGPDRVQPRPVFPRGALRSGASLSTLTLGHQPNLLHMLETNWLERAGIRLPQ